MIAKTRQYQIELAFDFGGVLSAFLSGVGSPMQRELGELFLEPLDRRRQRFLLLLGQSQLRLRCSSRLRGQVLGHIERDRAVRRRMLWTRRDHMRTHKRRQVAIRHVPQTEKAGSFAEPHAADEMGDRGGGIDDLVQSGSDVPSDFLGLKAFPRVGDQGLSLEQIRDSREEGNQPCQLRLIVVEERAHHRQGVPRQI
jgi:hypothetical protein